jgi:hypothetical protein
MTLGTIKGLILGSHLATEMVVKIYSVLKSINSQVLIS